jgi:hypothetical protein
MSNTQLSRAKNLPRLSGGKTHPMNRVGLGRLAGLFSNLYDEGKISQSVYFLIIMRVSHAMVSDICGCDCGECNPPPPVYFLRRRISNP